MGGGGGGQKSQKRGDVLCERPLMKNVHEGTKKSGRKFLLGAEYDSWVLKFERRKHTAFQEIKKSRTKKNS